MQNNDSFLRLWGEYFGNTAILPLFVIAVIWLFRKWNTEKRRCFLCAAGVSILLLYNGLTYAAAQKVGEAETYYRFIWICPFVLICAFLITEVFMHIGKEKKLLGIIIFPIAIFLFSSKLPSTWVNIPQNVYQLDSEVIKVSDIIMDLTGGESAKMIDDGAISATIRQYNAKIIFTDRYVYNIQYVLQGNHANYIGYHLLNDLLNNNSDYFLVKKEAVTAGRVLESVGLKKAAESSSYDIYWRDSVQMMEDIPLLSGIKERSGIQSNLEYVPIDDIETKFDIVYLSDLGVEENTVVYQNVIDEINTLQPEFVIINSQLSENADWYLESQDWLAQLTVPYYFNNEEFQIIEKNGVIFCMMNNVNGFSVETVSAFEELQKKDMPIILVLTCGLNENDAIYELVMTEESRVEQILTVRKNSYQKDLLENKIMQYATPADNNTMFNIVRVKGR